MEDDTEEVDDHPFGPNILITGTPGTGKSTLCGEIAERTGLEWIDISQFAVKGKFCTGYDDEYECQILNEEAIVDALEDKMKLGGNIIDYHGCDFFPERWFDIVFVLQTDNTILYDRLTARGYSQKKITNNVQCEIFLTILDEARASYKEDIVHQLPSNIPDEMEDNLERIEQWVAQWKTNQANQAM